MRWFDPKFCQVSKLITLLMFSLGLCKHPMEASLTIIMIPLTAQLELRNLGVAVVFIMEVEEVVVSWSWFIGLQPSALVVENLVTTETAVPMHKLILILTDIHSFRFSNNHLHLPPQPHLSSSSRRWVIDFAATDHMKGDSDIFSSFSHSSNHSSVILVDGSKVHVKGNGCSTLVFTLPLPLVLYLP